MVSSGIEARTIRKLRTRIIPFVFILFMIAALIAIGSLLLWAGRMSFRAGGTRYTARIGFRFSFRSRRPEPGAESARDIEGKRIRP